MLVAALGCGLICALTAADTPPEVTQAVAALETPAPAKEATAEAWGTWLHNRAAAKKQLLGAGDLAVAPLVGRIRDLLGLDRNGQDVLQGRNEVLHSYYSILASLQPAEAGPLLIEIAWLRDDHPYREERTWALWSLGNMTFQEFLADTPQPTDAQIHAGAVAARDWWKLHGGKPWSQWREEAIVRAHEAMDGTHPDKALAALSFLVSQNLIDPTALKALKSLIAAEGRTWEELRNFHRARAISLAVRLRRVEFEPLFLTAAQSGDPAISQAGLAALGAVGTEASLETLVRLAADSNADRALDALIAGAALTGVPQATAEEFKLWAEAHKHETQGDWWLAGLPGLIDRATKGDTAAYSILYARVRRPMPPVSLDDLQYPQYGPEIETWPQWYERVKETLAWDKSTGQVVLSRAP